MRIKISTIVNGNYKKVIAHFVRPLFEALKPKQADIEIIEFTGSKKGDKVHIRFKKPLKGDWISHITADGISNDEAFFVDEGITMPFGIIYWKHRHIVRKYNENESVIIDDITFKASNAFTGILMYPFLWISFYQRKKVYKRFFKDF